MFVAASLLLGGLLLGQAEKNPPSAKGSDKAPAAEKSPALKAREPEVRKLILELNAKELSTRDAAEKSLLALGFEILPLLPREAKSPETALRLERIRKSLEQAKVEASTSASTISLKGELPLKEILAQFEKQSGNAIIDYREEFGGMAENPDLKIDLEKKSFWQAMDEVLDLGKLKLYGASEKPGLALIGAEEEDLPRLNRAVYAGAFRVECQEVLARRDRRAKKRDSLQVTMEIAWEPRLTPISFKQLDEELVIEDEEGKALERVNPEATIDIDVTPGTSSSEFMFHLHAPPRSVKKISRIKGVFHALMPSGIEKFEFKDLAAIKKSEQRRSGAKVTLERVQKNNELWEVRVSLGFDKTSGALESHRGWVFNNPAYMLDADKKQVAYLTQETTSQTEDSVGIAFYFSGDIDLAKHTFVYETPTDILQKNIEYEIKDVDLP